MKQSHPHNQAIGPMHDNARKHSRRPDITDMDMMPVFITDFTGSLSVSFPNTGNKDLSNKRVMKTSQQQNRK